jgi:hypothetical protein
VLHDDSLFAAASQAPVSLDLHTMSPHQFRGGRRQRGQATVAPVTAADPRHHHHRDHVGTGRLQGLRPPWMRHFPFCIAGHRHGRPPRVLAPQRGASFIRAGMGWFIGLSSENFRPPVIRLLVIRTPDNWTCLKAVVRVCPGEVSPDKNRHVRVLSVCVWVMRAIRDLPIYQ